MHMSFIGNEACGNWNFHSGSKRSDESFKISFDMISYHPKTSRKLTFDEYKRTSCKPWHSELTEDQLYIMTVDMSHLKRSHVEILFYVVDNNGRDLQRLCNLSDL